MSAKVTQAGQVHCDASPRGVVFVVLKHLQCAVHDVVEGITYWKRLDCYIRIEPPQEPRFAFCLLHAPELGVDVP